MKKYCLDTNCFIEAWNKYYSPDFCGNYWDVLEKLGREGVLFIPAMVKKEIDKKDDELSQWLKRNSSFVKPITEDVQIKLREIYAKDSSHRRLVDTTKERSMADPWVIAHALAEDAVVVTKEALMGEASTKVKIPNVCENMDIEWMDDFSFIRETNILFNCSV
ncbi:MAG: DUF4411 family protein [Rhodothermaceae bacterium]